MANVIFAVLNAGMSNEQAALKIADDVMGALVYCGFDYESVDDAAYQRGIKTGMYRQR